MIKMCKNNDKIRIIKTKIFKDFRGTFVESFNKKKYYKLFKIKFVQDNFSSSKKNILRGFHGDNHTWKLVSCVKGRVQFAFINFNKKSNFYKEISSITLTEEDNIQILVPPKFGTAHLILTKDATIHYKQSTYYKQYKQFTINFQSPSINFKWKSKKISTSKRDKGGIFI